MSFSKAKELQEKRQKLHADATELLKKAPMSAEDRTKFDGMMAEMETLKGDIDRIQRAEAMEAEFSTTEHREVTQPGNQPTEQQQNEQRAKAERTALRRFLIGGENALRPEDRAVMRRANDSVHPELRDMGTGGGNALQGSGGGYFVPVGFVNNVESAMKWYGGMIEVASIIETATGQPLPHPTDNDTSNVGEIITEGSQVNTQDVTLSTLTLNAFKYSTKMVKVSIEMLQDSAFDIDTWLANKFGIRLGRITNTHFTTGAGTTLPFGIVTQAVAGPTAVGASGNTGGSDSATNTIGSTDLFELEHSVDKAYRRGAKYMMHDTTLKTIKEVLDKYGRPLWKPGLNAADPDTINGYAYVINNDMAVPAAGAKTVLFGALDKYIIRRVKELSVLRLTERFADYGQVAFLGFARYDGNLLDAGTHPVKYLIQHT
jgi:HK97 family phage major capsid protein